jgi:serine/threonine protein kinase
VKITNMDLSIRESGQLETLCCGRPGFIAPEVLNKEGYGTKADVFSCGVLLYGLYFDSQTV